jgi:hypothetical protein
MDSEGEEVLKTHAVSGAARVFRGYRGRVDPKVPRNRAARSGNSTGRATVWH